MNSMQLTRLALIIGRVREVAARERSFIEDLLERIENSETDISDFTLGWYLGSAEQSMAHSADRMRDTLLALGIECPDFAHHELDSGLEVCDTLDHWLETIESREAQISELYEQVRQMAIDAPESKEESLIADSDLQSLIDGELSP